MAVSEACLMVTPYSVHVVLKKRMIPAVLSGCRYCARGSSTTARQSARACGCQPASGRQGGQQVRHGSSARHAGQHGRLSCMRAWRRARTVK